MIENIKNSDVRINDALLERKNFGPFVRTVMKELDLTHDDICDEFPVSIPTVERWVEGVTMPREKMQAYVVARLATLVVKSAQE